MSDDESGGLATASASRQLLRGGKDKGVRQGVGAVAMTLTLSGGGLRLASPRKKVGDSAWLW
jgi:hypothetical protein